MFYPLPNRNYLFYLTRLEKNNRLHNRLQQLIYFTLPSSRKLIADLFCCLLITAFISSIVESACNQGCILDYECYFSKFKLKLFACYGRVLVWVRKVIFGKRLIGYGSSQWLIGQAQICTEEAWSCNSIYRDCTFHHRDCEAHVLSLMCRS